MNAGFVRQHFNKWRSHARARMYCSRNRFYLFEKVIVPSCIKKLCETRRDAETSRGSIQLHNLRRKQESGKPPFLIPRPAGIKIHVLANTPDNIWDWKREFCFVTKRALDNMHARTWFQAQVHLHKKPHGLYNPASKQKSRQNHHDYRITSRPRLFHWVTIFAKNCARRERYSRSGFPLRSRSTLNFNWVSDMHI